MDLSKDIIEEAVKSALLELEKAKNDEESDDVIAPEKSATKKTKKSKNSKKVVEGAEDTESGVIDLNQPLETIETSDDDDVEDDEDDIVEDEMVDEEEIESDLEDESDEDTEDVKSVEVADEIAEAIDESIENSGKYNIFGIDISVEKTEDGKYSVELKAEKDDSVETKVLDTVDTQTLFDAVQDFMNSIIVKECDSCDDEEEMDEEAEDSEDEVSEDVDEEKIKEDVMENPDIEDDEKIYAATMSHYMCKYREDLDAIIAQGLAAKQLALELVKDKVLASDLKEMNEKKKSSDALLSEKKQALENAKMRYLVAKKIDMQYDKAYTVLAQGIKNIADALKNEDMTSEEASAKVKRYRSMLATIINSRDSAVIASVIDKATRYNSVISSRIERNKKRKTITANKFRENGQAIVKRPLTSSIDRQPCENVIRPRVQHILNADTIRSGNSLMDSSSAAMTNNMIAEIIKISGIKDFE